MNCNRIQVPTNTPDSYQTVVMSGVSYVLRLYINTRNNCWYMDIYDAQRNPIQQGTRITLNTELAPFLPGILMVLDSTGTDTQPTYDSLGNQVELLYFYT